MKKAIPFIFGMIILWSCTVAAFSNEHTDPLDIHDESVAIKETGEWTIGEYVDDFGDGTGEKYIKSISKGTFSNTATNGSDLRVITFFDLETEVFSFRLLEYNESKATYFDNDRLRILFKFGDEIEEYSLYGTPLNGDLRLRKAKEENVLFNNLDNGNDARCVIYIASSKYSFTISSDGFSDALDVILGDKYKEAERLLSEKEYDQAIEAFENLNGYSDSAQKILEAKYKKAEQFLSEKKYDKAIVVFEDLDGYGDSTQKINETKYKKAESLFNDEKYSKAQELFASLDDYSDSVQMVERCKELITDKENKKKYKQAERDMESGDYDAAIEIFSVLGEYSDSKDRVQECLNKKYQKAVSKYENGEFQEAQDIFISLGEYLDAQSKAQNIQPILDQKYSEDLASAYLAAETDLSMAGEYLTMIPQSYEPAKNLHQIYARYIPYSGNFKLMQSGYNSEESFMSTFVVTNDGNVMWCAKKTDSEFHINGIEKMGIEELKEVNDMEVNIQFENERGKNIETHVRFGNDIIQIETTNTLKTDNSFLSYIGYKE